ncbi:MAG: beta-galactosidase, partial [Candidatus Lokiarchaeota archaeon]
MNGLSIAWDKYSLVIDGKRIFIRSGEFHYWRLPDRNRWRDILQMYKIAGLNTVRIYFHWG